MVADMMVDMETTFEQFRASITRERGRSALGIELPQAEADRVAADEALAHAYFDNWKRTGLGAFLDVLPEVAEGRQRLQDLDVALGVSRVRLFQVVSELSDLQARGTLIAGIEVLHAAAPEHPSDPNARVESIGWPNVTAGPPYGVPYLSDQPLARPGSRPSLSAGVWGLVLAFLSWVTVVVGLIAAISLGRPGTPPTAIFTGWAIVAGIIGIISLFCSIASVRAGLRAQGAPGSVAAITLGVIGIVLIALLFLTFLADRLIEVSRA